MATARSNASDVGGANSVTMSASASTNRLGGSSAASKANFGGNTTAMGSLANPLIDTYPTAYAYGIAQPDATLDELTENRVGDNVSAAFLNQTLLGAGVLGANYGYGYEGEQTFSASAEFKLDAATGSRLTLGLLDLGTVGWFDSLSLSVRNGDTALAFYTFTSRESADAFFSDNTIDLGAISGALDLFLEYRLIAHQDAGAALQFRVGRDAGADPAAAWLLLSGLSLVGVARRRFAISR